MTDVRMKVWRGDSTGGEFVEYSVPTDEGMVVLDVVHRIQATQAPDLAVRWNCKAGKCGSCSAEINGKPEAHVHDADEHTSSRARRSRRAAEDVPGHQGPRHRRLLQLREGEDDPARSSRSPKEADGTRRMYQEDVDRVQEFRKCIECFLCQDVCHVIRDHAENKPAFAGPRCFVRLAALEMHPLDTNDRIDLARQKHGLGYCNITKCCTEVCPEHINITDNAIIPLKERVVTRNYDPIAWALRRMRGQPADLGAGEPEPPSA